MQLIADPAVKADPYPTYERLREAFPVFPSILGPLVISRYDDCLSAMRDPRLGRGLNVKPPEGHYVSLSSFQADEAWRDQIREALTTSMLFLDPPEHTRLRGLVSRVFTPQRVDRLRAGAEAAMAAMLDDLADAGEADVLSVVGSRSRWPSSATWWASRRPTGRGSRDWSAGRLGPGTHRRRRHLRGRASRPGGDAGLLPRAAGRASRPARTTTSSPPWPPARAPTTGSPTPRCVSTIILLSPPDSRPPGT